MRVRRTPPEFLFLPSTFNYDVKKRDECQNWETYISLLTNELEAI